MSDVYAPPQSNLRETVPMAAGTGKGVYPPAVGPLFTATLDRMKEHGAVALLGTLMLSFGSAAVNMPFAFLPAFVRGLAIGLAGEQGLSEGMDLALALLGVVAQLLGVVMQVLSGGYVLVGMARGNLAIARGGPVSLGDYFPTDPGLLAQGALANLVSTLAIVAGFCLFIVPGVLAMVGLWLWPMALLDERRGALDALRRSWELTDGHKMDILVWHLVMFALGVLVTLPTCGLGLFVVLPMLTIGLSLAWLGLVAHEGERLPAPP